MSSVVSPIPSRFDRFLARLANWATYSLFAVSECGPRLFAICSAIALFFSTAVCFCFARTFAVPSNASRMSSSIVKSNCCGCSVCVVATDIRFGPVAGGGGGGPLLDDAAT